MRTALSLSFGHLKWLWSVLALIAVLFGLSACGGGGSSAPTPTSPSPSGSTATASSSQVKIVEVNGKYAFDPATLTVKKGTQVLWTNMSDAPHTVTSDTGAFQTPGTITEQQTFQFTFNTAGTFLYHCTVHPYMTATIIVTS